MIRYSPEPFIHAGKPYRKIERQTPEDAIQAIEQIIKKLRRRRRR